MSSSINYRIDQHGNSKYFVNVIFLKLYGNDINTLTNYRSAYYTPSINSENIISYEAHEANLHAFVPTTIWKNGARVAYTQHGPLIAEDGHHITGELSSMYFYNHTYEVDQFGQINYVCYNKRYTLKIPVMEIIRYFYLSDSTWNSALFRDEFKNPNNIYNKDDCWIREGVCHIKLRKQFSYVNQNKIALFYTSEAFKNNLFNISNMIQIISTQAPCVFLEEADSPFTKISLPFHFPNNYKNFDNEQFSFKFIGTIEKQSYPDHTEYKIHRIVSCEFQYPFEILDPDRDNNGFECRVQSPNSTTNVGSTISSPNGNKQKPQHESDIQSIGDGQTIPIEDKDLSIVEDDFPNPKQISKEGKIRITNAEPDIIITTEECETLLTVSTEEPSFSVENEDIPVNLTNKPPPDKDYQNINFAQQNAELKLQLENTGLTITTLSFVEFPSKIGLKYAKFKNRPLLIWEIMYKNSYFYYFDTYGIENLLPQFAAAIFCNINNASIIPEIRLLDLIDSLMESGSTKGGFEMQFPKYYKKINHSQNGNRTVGKRIQIAIEYLFNKVNHIS